MTTSGDTLKLVDVVFVLVLVRVLLCNSRQRRLFSIVKTHVLVFERVLQGVDLQQHFHQVVRLDNFREIDQILGVVAELDLQVGSFYGNPKDFRVKLGIVVTQHRQELCLEISKFCAVRTDFEDERGDRLERVRRGQCRAFEAPNRHALVRG